MIEFLTLFLTLVTGPRPVTVEVDGAVSAVEFHLDGELVERRTEPPWSTEVDFGSQLQPRELEAVALGADGGEVDRVSQWINLPRPRAEARLKLVTPRTASLSWEALDQQRPTDIELTFDNRELAFSDPKAIAIPPYGTEEPHYLAAQLTFPGEIQAGAVLTLSGELDAVDSELTAIPIRVGEQAGTPSLEGLAGAFSVRDRPLKPVAVDHGPADVVVVQDFRVDHELFDRVRTTLPDRPHLLEAMDALGPRDRLKVVEPAARVRAAGKGGAGPMVFPTFSIRDGSIVPGVVAGGLRAMVAEEDIPAQRLADAVAVAGKVAAQSNRRRAVVLILSSKTRDESRFDPATVRRYLEELRVPLHVWTMEKLEDGEAPPAFAGWGPVKSLYRPRSLASAAQELDDSLQRQYVVWVEGRHLPNRVRLSQAPADLRLAGSGGAT